MVRMWLKQTPQIGQDLGNQPASARVPLSGCPGRLVQACPGCVAGSWLLRGPGIVRNNLSGVRTPFLGLL